MFAAPSLQFHELLIMQETFFESLHQASSTLKSADGLSPAKLKVRLEYLKSTWAKCRELHAQLVHDATDLERRHPYFKDNQFATEEILFLDAVSDIEEAMEPYHTPHTSLIEEPLTTMASTGQRGQHRRTIQLIELPRFAGGYNKREAFCDLFKSLIINDDGLDDVRKLLYLRCALSGEPLNIIAHLECTNDNFHVAWTALESYYANKRCIVDNHLHEFFSLPTLRRESASELRDFYSRLVATVGALESVGEPVGEWNSILVYSVTSKLDSTSRRDWEISLGSRKTYPSFAELKTFIQNRIHGLQAVCLNLSRDTDMSKSGSKPLAKPSQHHKSSVQSHATNAAQKACPACSTSVHPLFKCKRFKHMTISARADFVQWHQLCVNCLGAHTAASCPCSTTCFVCKRKYHTMLHPAQSSGPVPTPVTVSQPASDPSRPIRSTYDIRTDNDDNVVLSHFTSNQPVNPSGILLATARVCVRSDGGRSLIVRAMLDQGATWTFVTDAVANALKCRSTRVSTTVSGMGGASAGSITRAAEIYLSPVYSDEPTFRTHAFMMRSLTSYVPTTGHPISRWSHLNGLQLADPDPSNSDPINLIIGADLYGSLLLDGILKGSHGDPTAQNTVFGWVLSGWTTSPTSQIFSSSYAHHCMNQPAIDEILLKFWEIESVPTEPAVSADDALCEQHFVATHSRDASGRFTVRLPFRHTPVHIGDSRLAPRAAFKSLEKRLSRNAKDSRAYRDFMEDYERQGHMTRVLSHPTHSPVVYLPYHGVRKEASTTTKLRVVFNASHITSNSTSLSTHLLPGPKLQADLSLVLLRWRTFQFVYCSDIAQMYRQILVGQRDRDFKRFIWRPTPDAAIAELNTVTFGVSSAPFLALRVLRQLAEEGNSDFANAVDVLRHGLYVDDLLFGANDTKTARSIRDQLTTLLSSAGFTLRKWASNAPDLLRDVVPSNHGLAWAKPLCEDDGIKILGVSWYPIPDHYRFKIDQLPTSALTNPHHNPLGWVAPVIVPAKVLVQELWLLALDWDDPLPAAIIDRWDRLYSDLPVLANLAIPRWTGQTDQSLCELHGFADASKSAYVYIRVAHDDAVSVALLMSRTKVAPIKQLSIPRLELCGALLLTRLLAHIRKVPQLAALPVVCWSDATVVLHWLQQHPTKWKTFVANRVSEIQTSLPEASWRHIPGPENPADLASRECLASELLTSPLWMSGPPWLHQPPDNWPSVIPT